MLEICAGKIWRQTLLPSESASESAAIWIGVGWVGDAYQITKMTKMGRMTWTTNMKQRSKWCPSGVTCQPRCPSGQHSICCWSSGWGCPQWFPTCVHHMFNMMPHQCPPRLGKLVKWFPRWCTISVHQGWLRRPICQVVSKLVKYQIQCGKYGDQVGQQQKQGIQTDVREIKEGFKIPC